MTSLVVFGATRGARAQPNPPPQPGPAPSTGGKPGPDSRKTGKFEEIDALLSQLSKASADMREFTAEAKAVMQRSAAQDCIDQFAAKNLLSDSLPNEMQDDVVQYYYCRAYAKRNPRECLAVDQIKFNDKSPAPKASLGEACQVLTPQLIAAPSIIARAPDAMSRCLEWMKMTVQQNRAPGEAVQKICALVVRRVDTRAIGAQAASLLQLDPKESAEFERHVGELQGDENACMKNGKKPEDVLTGCMSFAVYRKAVSAHDSSLCGGSWQCRLMMSKAGNCDAYEKKVARAYCRSVAQANRQQRYQAAFVQKKIAIDAILNRLGPDIQGFEPKNQAKFKSRKERFAELRDGLQKIMNDFQSSGAPKRAAKPRPTAAP